MDTSYSSIISVIWQGIDYHHHPATTGRPAVDKWKMFCLIMRKLKHGLSWEALVETEDLDESTVRKTFNRWARQGLFTQLYDQAREGYEKLVGYKPDGCVDVMVNYAANGGDLSVRHPLYKGKSCYKLSILVDTAGVPMSFVLGAGTTHDSKLLESTLQNNVQSVDLLWADLGYHGAPSRSIAEGFGAQLVVPVKRKRGGKGHKVKKKGFGLDPVRWVVERTFSWLARFKEIKHTTTRLIEGKRAWVMLGLSVIIVRKLLQVKHYRKEFIR